MFKKVIALLLACTMPLAVTGCEEEGGSSNDEPTSNAKKQYTLDDLPKYEPQEFEICGLWAPTEMTEEAFLQYKEAGFKRV